MFKAVETWVFLTLLAWPSAGPKESRQAGFLAASLKSCSRREFELRFVVNRLDESFWAL